MSKKKSHSATATLDSPRPGKGSEGKRKAGGKPDRQARRASSAATIRETVESIVIAFVLAFLFRTFEAEAFVIPTGSMAPTLMGRHKDLVCPKCGYAFQVSASSEVDADTNEFKPDERVRRCLCPMCRFPMWLDDENNPSYNGDRILVGKFAYEFAGPQRWDVAVFKYPGKAKTNFIKRLVGLPEETIRIRDGDLYVKLSGSNAFQIARKSNKPGKLLAMLQMVYDNDYVLKQIIDKGWRPRWQGELAADAPGAWMVSDDYKSFQSDGTAEGEVWLRYRHFVPSQADWDAWDAGVTPPGKPHPQLVTDFLAYNTGQSVREVTHPEYRGIDPSKLGLNWVGDLAMRCEVDVQSDSGLVTLELVEGGQRFQCRIDVASGVARLIIPGRAEPGPSAPTGMIGPGQYRVTFANIDDELLLWVDGDLVAFGAPTVYDGDALGTRRPRRADLAPAGVATDGAAVAVRHLQLLRDLYYIAMRPGPGENGNTLATDLQSSSEFPGNGVTQFMSGLKPKRVGGREELVFDPSVWDAFKHRNQVEFALGADQFLVLGDNSACSRDSRLWESTGFPPYVKRELLIGKAIFVYWPHSWDKMPIPFTGKEIPFPFFPNFKKMRLVR